MGQRRIIRMRQLVEKMSMGRATIYKLIAESKFPPGFLIGPGGRCVGWFEDVVDDWLQARALAGPALESREQPEDF
jgi:prophage regulatory protein